MQHHVAYVSIGANEAAREADLRRSARVHTHEVPGDPGHTEELPVSAATMEDKTLVEPNWHDCLEYEFQLRKEAFRLVQEQSLGIQVALHAAPNNPHDRMEHWVTFLAVAKPK